MYKVSDWYEVIDGFAPFSTAMSFDNAGLLVGSGHTPAGSALLALDLTHEVIGEAVKRGIPLIITHHPVIFHPLKSVPAESLIYRLAANGLSVICAHTNLDLAEGGVNDALAKQLELLNIRPFQLDTSKSAYKLTVFVPIENAEAVYQAMVKAGAGGIGNYSGVAYFGEGEGRFLPVEGAHPAIGTVGVLEKVREHRIELIVPRNLLGSVVTAMKEAHPYEEVAYDVYEDFAVQESLSLGRVGDLPEAVSPKEYAYRVKTILNAGGIRMVEGGASVRTVAVCGGSGGSMLADAAAAGAQALVTGEAKHDEFLQAQELGMTLIDAGHYFTEAVIIEPLAKRLGELLPEAEIVVSRQNSNGVLFL